MNLREEKNDSWKRNDVKSTDGCVFIRRAPGLKTLTVMRRSSG